MRMLRRFITAATAAIAGALASAPAANILVYNTNDAGAGSLRQAILQNTALGGGHTVIFSNVVSGTITLTSGELFLDDDVTILGPGAGILAVNGNAASRVFELGAGTTVTISGLTITHGAFPGGGGGIYNYQAALTVAHCLLSGNSARNGGAIYNDHGFGSATVTIQACTFSTNAASYGGAIYNDGSGFGSAQLTVSDSTFRGNSANYGGGIYNNGTSSGNAGVGVSTSTFDGNAAFFDTIYGGGLGGAIYSDGQSGGSTVLSVNASTFSGNSAQNGGGLYNNGFQGSASLYVNVSTFSGNSATYDGGGINNFGYQGSALFLVSGSTFSGNSAGESGGGLYNASATLQIGDTILNAGSLGANLFNTAGTVTSLGYNLSSDSAGGLLVAVGDQANTDPLLETLRDNGGPTLTHGLLPGSPALDRGKRNAVAALPSNTDQRGQVRPFDFTSLPNAPGGDGSDIGAFEVTRPTLSIQKAGSNAVLSWPAYFSGFTLQASTNAAVPTSWISAGGVAVLVGNEYQQTNGPVSGNKFFRLRN